MDEESMVGDEADRTPDRKGILKVKGNVRESATLTDVNEYRSTASGGRELIEESSDSEETATVPCGKNSKDFITKFVPPFFRRGCSKHCTGHKREPDDSSLKFTVCKSKKRNNLARRMKRSKKMLEQFSQRVKRETKKSVRKIKKMYKKIGARRAMGYNCDLNKCPSSIMDCSASSCAKPNMIFNEFHRLKETIMGDREDEYDGTDCAGAEGTNHEFKVLKDQSVGTSVDKETST